MGAVTHLLPAVMPDGGSLLCIGYIHSSLHVIHVSSFALGALMFIRIGCFYCLILTSTYFIYTTQATHYSN